MNGMGSVEDIAHLFQDPAIMAAGWLHYLAFDLFMGIPHVFVVPCLVLTFGAGPIGWLAYFAVRTGLRHGIVLKAGEA